MDSDLKKEIVERVDEEEDDNITLQREELEALSSIYGEDFVLEEEDPPTFTIRLNNAKKEASLMISFESNYPKASPPIYHLSIPWIRGDHKKAIYASLEQLYLDHIGESIVYIFVEKLREVLERQCDVELKSDENVLQQDLEKNPISDKLIASVSRLDLDCSDSTTSNTASNNQTLHNSTTTVPHSSPLGSHLHPSQPYENKMLPGCKIPSIITGESFTDRKSTFQAHVAPIHDASQVRVVLDELYKNKKIATATHNMYAFRIFKEETSTWIQDCEDDGETHAGSRLLHLIQILNCRNVIVVVTRWFGGIQLHSDRFKHINNVARQLLEQQGFIINNCLRK